MGYGLYGVFGQKPHTVVYHAAGDVAQSLPH
jgi:hypothetical protein